MSEERRMEMAQARLAELGGVGSEQERARLCGALDQLATLEGPPVAAETRFAQVQAAMSAAARPQRAQRRYLLAALGGAAVAAVLLLVRMTTTPVAVPVAPVAERWVDTADERAHLQLADGSELSAAPRSRLQLRRRRVNVQAGSATLMVRHAGGEPFEVFTPEARVTVVGTRFTVARDEATATTVITVEEGIVEVEAENGGGRRRLVAGEHVTIVAGVAAPVVAVVATPPAVAPIETAPLPVPERRRVTPPSADSRRAAAEVQLRQAEDLVAKGQFTAAVARYLAVAERHPDGREAELALFAAASLGAEHLPPPRARALLQRYLERHPRGSFASQTRKLLAALPD